MIKCSRDQKSSNSYYFIVSDLAEFPSVEVGKDPLCKSETAFNFKGDEEDQMVLKQGITEEPESVLTVKPVRKTKAKNTRSITPEKVKKTRNGKCFHSMQCIPHIHFLTPSVLGG